MLPYFIPFFVATSVASQAVRVAATAAPVSCASTTTACDQFENELQGPGLIAESTNGVGFTATTSSGNYLYPGLDGEAYGGGAAAGSFGVDYVSGSPAPTYGVLAYGILDGLYGATGDTLSEPDYAAGVFGQDDGLSSFPDYNAGVLGASTVGTGVLGESNGSVPSSESQFGMDTVGAWAVAHTSSAEGTTYGLVAESDTTPLVAFDSGGENYVALAEAGVGDMIVAAALGSSPQEFVVDLKGDGDITGTMKTKKGTYARTTGASGARRTTYGLRGDSPLIEDTGEAELTNGRAYVALDAALADSIDPRRPYHVFVMPEGESNQLYVAEKTPVGFVVREADGGRSTLPFEYRIVGKPFDDDGTAFAAETSRAAAMVRGSHHGGARIAPPLSPQARLRQSVGAQRYTQALRDARTVAIASRVKNSASPALTVTCQHGGACATYDNTSSGSGLSASSVGGIGVTGLSYDASYQGPGVDGESENVTGSDASAAFGLDFLTLGSAPTYGALAYGDIDGLYGATENGGSSPSAYAAGVFGQDELASFSQTDPRDYNEGVLGSSSVGTGVLAESNGTPAAGYFGAKPIGIYAVGDAGNASHQAVGAFAESNDVALEAEIPEPNLYVDLVRKTSSGFDLIHAANGYAYSFVFTSTGNAAFSGTVTTSMGTYARTTGASGAVRIAYGSREASPEVESIGEAQLTNGRAYVALDPVLADSLDLRRPYDVFVTSEGSGKSLYVAERTPAGFVVRESRGGRSTLAFEYRIIGKPVDDDSRRLAVAAVPAMPARPARGGPRIPAPLSPSARALSKGSL